MSLDAMKQALEALNKCQDWPGAYEECSRAITALRAAIEQAQGLAEKIPAKGTLLEQTLKDVWDEMPHAALMDAIIGGTGVMLGDKRIDPASIYRHPEQEPVAWMYHGIRHDDTPHERPSLIWRPDQMDVMSFEKGAKATPLYTAPRQWQGLTQREIDELWDLHHDDYGNALSATGYERAIEAKLRERNA